MKNRTKFIIATIATAVAIAIPSAVFFVNKAEEKARLDQFLAENSCQELPTLPVEAAVVTFNGDSTSVTPFHRKNFLCTTPMGTPYVLLLK